jgi:2-polyprenyl-6-methoxyphenol hydroxylase-like FAD-dependent oxidoreductase
MSRSPATEVAIVGAGPYGLSVAAHLHRHGRPFRIFGTPMRSWRANMPAGMFLKSEGCA